MDPRTTRPPRASAPSFDAPRPPAVIGGRYVIERQIGLGSMGAVYEAYDSARAQRVAVKRLTARVEDPWTSAFDAAPMLLAERERERRRRRLALFQHEYRVLEQLAHPRIIEVYDYGVDELGPYYSMELLRGHTAEARVPRGFQETCSILRDVASALALVHARQLLHRDVSPANVHIDEAGVAKLIDFGALTPIGKPQMMIGTPAFMAPEALALEPLDARSDLYSLGALGYWLLSGRTVGHASNAALKLRERAQNATITLPSAVPPAFEGLLLQLLSADKAARPSSASEVLERLRGILGVDAAESAIDAGAYLASPELVGRTRVVRSIARRAVRTVRRRGDFVLVRGEPGSGRSRVLEAGCIEAKLAGLMVVRVGAAQGSGRPFSTARALLRSLYDQLAEAERPELMLDPELMESLGIAFEPAFPRTSERTPSAPARSIALEEHARIADRLASFFSRVAARRPLLLAIDDLDRIDAASGLVVARLGTSVRERRILLLAAFDCHAEAGEALRAFEPHARTLPIEALSTEETDVLVRALLGDVPNLTQVARTLYERSHGNVRLIIEMVRHLVERRVVRHENGAFVLPEALAADELPDSYVAALEGRVGRLSASAKRLVAVLALLDGGSIASADAAQAAELSAPDFARSRAELLAAGLVALEEDALRVRHPNLQVIGEGVFDRAQEIAVRVRLGARLAADPAQRLWAALQYLSADRGEEAVRLTIAAVREESDELRTRAGASRLLERCIVIAASVGASEREIYLLRRALADQVLRYFDVCDREPLLALHASLVRLAGLADWQALADEPDERARVMRALNCARERHHAAPAHERVMPPEVAIRELLQLTAMLVGHASSSLDLELLARLPSMAAFAMVTPLFSLVEELRLALLDGRMGRYDSYLERMRRNLERLAQPDGAGVPEKERPRARANQVYGLAIARAAWGDPQALALADELERVPDQRVNAWSIREIAYLYACEVEESDRCRREAERLKMELGPRVFHPGAMLDTRLWAYSACDDLLKLRTLAPQIERMGARYPGWRPAIAVVHCEIERLRGRPERTLSLCRQAMAEAPVGRNLFWPHAAGREVRTLLELGETARARELARRYIAECDASGVQYLRLLLENALAECDALCGDLDAAVARIDEVLAHRYLRSGLLLGSAYETRARIAIIERKPEQFRRAYERARRELKYGAHAAVTARLDRLLERAENAGVAPRAGAALHAPNDYRDQLQGSNPRERAARALALLIAAAGCEGAQLFGVGTAELSLLAAQGCNAAPSELELHLRLRVMEANQLEADETAVLLEPAEGPGARIELAGELYEPVMLFAERGDYSHLVGITALRVGAQPCRALSFELLAAVADAIAIA